jgi:TPR repeat protein
MGKRVNNPPALPGLLDTVCDSTVSFHDALCSNRDPTESHLRVCRVFRYGSIVWGNQALTRFRRAFSFFLLVSVGFGARADSADPIPPVTEPIPSHVGIILQGAQQGNAVAQFLLGTLFLEGDVLDRDGEQALHWLRSAALQGIPDAQYNLGVMRYDGDLIPRDYAQAARWFRMASQQGFADAQLELGVMYFEGRGVPKNHEAAARWLKKAAAEQLAEAQFNLGVLFEQGEGVARSYDTALDWYRKAAVQGDMRGQFAVGRMYDLGRGVARDHGRAARWYRRSAEQGYGQAQYLLALKYQTGQGVEADRVRAYVWFDLAAMNEVGAAAVKRTRMSALMTPTEIASAQKSVREWRPKPFALVRSIQHGLTNLGYSPGPVDGVFGRGTRAAIRDFERDLGRPPVGEPTESVLTALNREGLSSADVAANRRP